MNTASPEEDALLADLELTVLKLFRKLTPVQKYIFVLIGMAISVKSRVDETVDDALDSAINNTLNEMLDEE